MGKRKRRVETAKVDEGNEEDEASAIPTIMRLMEEERRKVMSRKIIRKRRKGKENWEIWT